MTSCHRAGPIRLNRVSITIDRREGKAAWLFCITFVTLLFIGPLAGFAATYHVRKSPTGDGPGSSWANASSSLDGILRSTTASDEVRIAAGTCLAAIRTFINPETPMPPRNEVGPLADTYASFVLPAGASMRGGFAGTETNPDLRNRQANPTVLSARCLDGFRSVFVCQSHGELVEGFIINGDQPRSIDLGAYEPGSYPEIREMNRAPGGLETLHVRAFPSAPVIIQATSEFDDYTVLGSASLQGTGQTFTDQSGGPNHRFHRAKLP